MYRFSNGDTLCYNNKSLKKTTISSHQSQSNVFILWRQFSNGLKMINDQISYERSLEVLMPLLNGFLLDK